MSSLRPQRTRVVAYLRVSTDKQADGGLSLDAQRVKVTSYAEVYDLEIVDVKIDAGESAKSLDRPALQEALAMLRSGEVQALLVVKLDRLTRSVRDLCDLVDDYFRDGSHALMSVSEQINTTSAAGRMVLSILTVIGQWEREAIGERTAAVMQHKAAQGEYTGGGAPFGFAVGGDGKLIPVDREQGAIARARELRAAGLSFRAVARALRAAGYRTRAGTTFQATQIARMVEAA